MKILVRATNWMGCARASVAALRACAADRSIADSDAVVILFGAVAEREIADKIRGAMRHRPAMLVGNTPEADWPARWT